MITNIWDKLVLVCGNHPDDKEEQMWIHEGVPGKSPFYSCPRYVSVFRKEGSKSCNNRFSINEMQQLIKKLEELIKDPVSPYNVNLMGYKWTENGIDYEVLKHSSEEIRISVLNRRAMSR